VRLQVNSETDFATKTADFQRTVAAVARAAQGIDPAHVSGANAAPRARSPALPASAALAGRS